MISKLMEYCNITKNYIQEGTFSIYELLNLALQKLDEVIDYVNTNIDSFQTQLNLKEDSSNITNSRRLDGVGNFTGTWFGETKASIDQKITDSTTTYNSLIALINSLTNFNIEVIDGKFFTTVELIEEIDAGDFTSSIVEEIDAGIFLFPCEC